MAFVKRSLDTECVSKAEMGKHVRFTNELMVIALVFWGLFYLKKNFGTFGWCPKTRAQWIDVVWQNECFYFIKWDMVMDELLT